MKDTLQRLAVLYELSSTIGISLEPIEFLGAFFRKLIDRGLFSYCSAWVLEDEEPRLVFAYPSYYTNKVKSRSSQELRSLILGDVNVFSASKHPEKFESLRWEEALPERGTFVVVGVTGRLFIKLFTEEMEHVEDRVKLLEHLFIRASRYLKACISYKKLRDTVQAMKKERNEKLKLSYTDTLTGLPNRAFFFKKLERLLGSEGFTLVGIVDLDNFKFINDTFGHGIGDKVLSAVALLMGKLAKDITVARISGDEFGLLMHGKDKRMVEEQVECFLESLRRELEKPLVIDHNRIFVSFSAGVYISSGKEEVSETMKKADIAMYQAKERGKARNVFIAGDFPVTDEQVLLKEGSWLEEVVPRCQPIVDARTLEVIGCELLMGTSDTDMPASTFVSILEKLGLVHLAERKLLQTALEKLPNRDRLMIHFNVSDIHLRRADFTEWLMNTIKRYDLEPQNLVLEISERKPLKYELDISILKELKLMNIKLALDDFGEGFASISYLRKLPIDIVKLDRSLIVNEDINFMKNVITLLKSMGFFIIAEGVEEERHLNRLKGLELSALQGYLFGKPKFMDSLPW